MKVGLTCSMSLYAYSFLQHRIPPGASHAQAPCPNQKTCGANLSLAQVFILWLKTIIGKRKIPFSRPDTQAHKNRQSHAEWGRAGLKRVLSGKSWKRNIAGKCLGRQASEQWNVSEGNIKVSWLRESAFPTQPSKPQPRQRLRRRQQRIPAQLQPELQLPWHREPRALHSRPHALTVDRKLRLLFAHSAEGGTERRGRVSSRAWSAYASGRLWWRLRTRAVRRPRQQHQDEQPGVAPNRGAQATSQSRAGQHWLGRTHGRAERRAPHSPADADLGGISLGTQAAPSNPIRAAASLFVQGRISKVEKEHRFHEKSWYDMIDKGTI